GELSDDLAGRLNQHPGAGRVASADDVDVGVGADVAAGLDALALDVGGGPADERLPLGLDEDVGRLVGPGEGTVDHVAGGIEREDHVAARDDVAHHLQVARGEDADV